jgi:DNA repair protein RadC
MKKNKLSTKDIQNALSDKSSVASDIIKDKKKTDGLIKKALATMEKVPGIGKYVDEIKYMCAMVRDYVKRDYTEVKLSTIIAVVASLV